MYINGLYSYSPFRVTTQSALQYSFLQLVFFHPCTLWFIQGIYVQHFLYYTSLTHCWPSHQGQFGAQYLAQGYFGKDTLGRLGWNRRTFLLPLNFLSQKYMGGGGRAQSVCQLQNYEEFCILVNFSDPLSATYRMTRLFPLFLFSASFVLGNMWSMYRVRKCSSKQSPHGRRKRLDSSINGHINQQL